ncbi:transcriptional corepressor LEUNIG-like [Sesamum indicum]|uniref:Transcriptional corepressor LEUNIG-like n=1 Tax=Sesamum indicum TaxID=4182 RepID=A0A6I9TLH5_SESIN|nr:transcriptional corepressor LEUNIG-like [Sesamum indicum]
MVIACHFSADGKLLATSDHDKKAVLWHTNTLEGKATLEEHTSVITDIRFSPCMMRLATSSLDKTVRVWDTNNPHTSLCKFTRHNCGVMSLDFHPNKDIVCSSDANGEIKYWSVNSGGCATVFKDCACQVRFQPLIARFLAAATANAVLILDAETQTCYHTLKGHQEPIHSVCWDHSGELLASVSDKSVRIWTMGTGNEWVCLNEHKSDSHKFHSCVFHPTQSSVLVLGCYQASCSSFNTQHPAQIHFLNSNVVTYSHWRPGTSLTTLQSAYLHSKE